MTPADGTHEQTLYDRIGGESAVAILIDDFYLRIKDDGELAPFFENVPMEKLRRMQREFFAVALGGEGDYSGRPLAYVHHGLGIKPRHFQRYVDHLDATLAGHELDDADHREIISRINLYVDEIVGSGGGVDG